jgi:SAM-dependent methyltransferase
VTEHVCSAITQLSLPARTQAIMQFDEFAKEYKAILDNRVAIFGEDSEYFAEYKARYIRKSATRCSPAKVLDFGCGIGLLSRVLKKYLPESELHGYDISAASIQRANRALAGQGMFTSDIAQLAHDYNLIVLANMMHHVGPSHRLSVMKQATDRLCPGGRLVLFEHNPANPITRWIVDHCPFDSDAILLWPNEAIKCMARAELRLLRRDYIVFLPRAFARFRPLEPFLSWLPLGAQYAIVGEKDA